MAQPKAETEGVKDVKTAPYPEAVFNSNSKVRLLELDRTAGGLDSLLGLLGSLFVDTL